MIIGRYSDEFFEFLETTERLLDIKWEWTDFGMDYQMYVLNKSMKAMLNNFGRPNHMIVDQNIYKDLMGCFQDAKKDDDKDESS